MTNQTEIQAGPLRVQVTITNGQLCSVTCPDEVPEGLTAAHLRELLAQLRAYPLAPGAATEFQEKVWERMSRIPWGEALTYSELAAEVGAPRAARAIGQVCGANPLLLIVPCHRVVAQDGLGGFRGGLSWKRKLLELESEAA